MKCCIVVAFKKMSVLLWSRIWYNGMGGMHVACYRVEQELAAAVGLRALCLNYENHNERDY